MKWRKAIGKIHLWLGLSTGVVVFIIAITGAIYCFAPELQELQSYRKVRKENSPFLPPSRMLETAESQLPGRSAQRIYYDAPDKSVMVLFAEKEGYSYSVFINPYDGRILRIRDNNRDPLSVVLQIHRTLLIPYGHDIIRWSTVIFILMLISGMLLWLPKNRRRIRQGFRVMWGASPKRLNYDLHKVFGFYVSWIAIFMALTGLMFAFKGFADFTYELTGAKNSVIRKDPPLSTLMANSQNLAGVDRVWSVLEPQLHRDYASVMFVLPLTDNGTILVRANPQKGTIYKSDFRYFDQYSGQEIPGAYVWGRYTDRKTLSDDIRRLNYDIHTGAIFGLPGRLGLFFLALVIASLPITGFIFWWGRKHKKPILMRSVKPDSQAAMA